MKVNYGPPGHKGVTQIMGLGNTEATVQPAELPAQVAEALPERAHRQVMGLAVGAWFAGAILGSSRLRSAALGAGAGVLLCAHLAKAEASQEAQAVALPTTEPFPVIDVSVGA